jgi:hypothetical protein
MRSKSKLVGPGRNRGSAFITTMLFTTVLLVILAGLLNLSLTERKLNNRNAYWLEARNAAESVAEYGAAQVAFRYQRVSTPPNFDPTSGTTALALPLTSSFSGTHVDTTAYSSSHTTGLQLIAGTAGQYNSTSDVNSVNGNIKIDATDPANSTDPLRSKYTWIQNVQVVAKATCVPADGSKPITCYVRQTVSVRSTPLFTNAIFYNATDLEIFPGPNFDIYGPVQVNGNIFASSQGSSLTFHDTVSASGELYHAWANQRPTADGTGGESLGSTPVNFAQSVTNNTQVNMFTQDLDPTTHQPTGSNFWHDSTNGSDSSILGASTGLYIDQATAALDQLSALNQLTSFKTFANGPTWNGNVMTGSMGATVAQPVSYTSPIDAAGHLPDAHTMIEPPSPPVSTDPYYSAKTQVETQKMSTQAGLYLQVRTVAGTTTISAYGPPSGVTGTPNGGALINSWTNPTSGVVTYAPYTTSGSNVTQGMYDRRQAAGVNLVQIDMVALNAALADTNGNSNADGKAITTTTGTVWGTGSTGWNGGIYVDVSEPSTPGPGVTQTAVILTNGAVSNGNSLIPSTNGVNGLTVATNGPVYVLGNFNADGQGISATSATTPDDGVTTSSSKEVPTAIYGDAITLLSPNYFGTANTTGVINAALPAAGGNNTAGSSAKTVISSSSTPSVSTSIEVAAAMVTGLVATTDTGSSGGVHNLPRFLEAWSGTVAIRGSLVAMYNSQTAIGKWSTSFYGPPTRTWGYDKLFKNGNFPPLTSRTLTFRRIQSNMSATSTQYVNALNTIWPGQTQFP